MDHILPIIKYYNKKIVIVTSQWHIPSLHRSENTDKCLNDENIILWIAQNPIYTNNKKQTKKKHLCPYVLKQYNNKWHMVAFDLSSSHDKKINVFLLDNISSIEWSNKPYFIDERFNPEDYFRYSIGIWHDHEIPPIKVKLEFSNEGYANLFDSIQNNPIHHLQKCTFNKPGNKMIVELEVYESSELYSIIRRFGSSVKVLVPQSVADKVKEDSVKVMNLYKSNHTIK
jgi:predicted DNA-binding transcriptional regulator YafY